MLTNADITLFNKRVNPATRLDEWQRTYIKGVSWKSKHIATVGERGLSGADETYIRIPEKADTEGKAYLKPTEYAVSEIPSWTVKAGDYIVKGIIDYDPANGITELVKSFSDVCVVLTTADNRDSRNSPRMRHWRVIAK